METLWVQILAAAYFVAMVTAGAKAARYYAEYKLTQIRIRLLGVAANLVLALAMGLIIVANGSNPIWDPVPLRLTIRFSIITWAILGASFEVLYAPSYVRLAQLRSIYPWLRRRRPKPEEEGRDAPA